MIRVVVGLDAWALVIASSMYAASGVVLGLERWVCCLVTVSIEFSICPLCPTGSTVCEGCSLVFSTAQASGCKVGCASGKVVLVFVPAVGETWSVSLGL